MQLFWHMNSQEITSVGLDKYDTRKYMSYITVLYKVHYTLVDDIGDSKPSNGKLRLDLILIDSIR